MCRIPILGCDNDIQPLQRRHRSARLPSLVLMSPELVHTVRLLFAIPSPALTKIEMDYHPARSIRAASSFHSSVSCMSFISSGAYVAIASSLDAFLIGFYLAVISLAAVFY